MQQLARLTMRMHSVFQKAHSIGLAKVLKTTQHVQYENFHSVGEINTSNSAIMKRELLNTVSHHKSILLDFTNLTYIDSSGIATLIESFNITDTFGLKLTIVGAK
ncbi:MAG: STAS domain-containing protein [Alteromonadaceae bacterium]|jgi:anti-anti-sigma factor